MVIIRRSTARTFIHSHREWERETTRVVYEGAGACACIFFIFSLSLLSHSLKQNKKNMNVRDVPLSLSLYSLSRLMYIQDTFSNRLRFFEIIIISEINLYFYFSLSLCCFFFHDDDDNNEPRIIFFVVLKLYGVLSLSLWVVFMCVCFLQWWWWVLSLSLYIYMCVFFSRSITILTIAVLIKHTYIIHTDSNNESFIYI